MRTLIFLKLFFAGIFCFGQIFEKPNLVVEKVSACLADADRSVEIEHCYQMGSSLFEKQITENIKILHGLLDHHQILAFNIAQAEWVKFKDKELAFFESTKIEGTMYYILYNERKYKLLKTRAVEIQEYIEDYTLVSD